MVTKSKTTERRHKLRLQLIEAAEAAVAANGMKSLTARDLAKQVGCSVGAIYNVFEDIDELVIAVNSRTLARLDRTIAAVRCTTVCSFVALKRREDRRRHHHSGHRQGKAAAGRRSSPSAMGTRSRQRIDPRSTSRPAIACCSASGPAPRSRSTAKSC
jgi:AcrR family transcriptional regulator